MGITGLIPFLSPDPTDLSQFAGCVAAVDAYVWIHKGSYRCSEQLYKGEETDEFVNYVLSRVDLLRRNYITPILVFDGMHLLSKKTTETERKQSRQINRNIIAACLQSGDNGQAAKYMQRCVDVTQEMAKRVIDACRLNNIDYIVAPYEADAQLAYLVREGFAHLAITEDSDLIVFGVQKCLFKLDYSGNGDIIDFTPTKMRECLGEMTFDKFRCMCILSGCDYLPSLPGIGLKKAKQFFKSTMDDDLKTCLFRVTRHLKLSKDVKVTQEYVDNFIKANNTFLYQLVFCPLKRQLVPLNAYSADMEECPEDLIYAGEYLDNELALQLAIGNVDVSDGKVIDSSFELSQLEGKEKSIWSSNYKKPNDYEEIVKNRATLAKTWAKYTSSPFVKRDNPFTKSQTIKRSSSKEGDTDLNKKAKTEEQQPGSSFASPEEINEMFNNKSESSVEKDLGPASSDKVIRDEKIEFKATILSRNIFSVSATNTKEDAVAVQSRFFSQTYTSIKTTKLPISNEVCHHQQRVEELKERLINNAKAGKSNSVSQSPLTSSQETVDSLISKSSDGENDGKGDDSLRANGDSVVSLMTDDDGENESDSDCDVVFVKCEFKPKLRPIGISRKSPSEPRRKSDIREFFTKRNTND